MMRRLPSAVTKKVVTCSSIASMGLKMASKAEPSGMAHTFHSYSMAITGADNSVASTTTNKPKGANARGEAPSPTGTDRFHSDSGDRYGPPKTKGLTDQVLKVQLPPFACAGGQGPTGHGAHGLREKEGGEHCSHDGGRNGAYKDEPEEDERPTERLDAFAIHTVNLSVGDAV